MLGACGRIDFDPLNAVVALDAHGGHACAFTGDGALRCWGNNGNGELGLGFTSPGETPHRVPIAAKAVGLGEFTTFVVDRNDQLIGFGDNKYGELGNGAVSIQETTPQMIPVEHVKEVSGGQYHSCALVDDGSVWCWGDNDCGRVGDTAATNHLAPFQITGIPPAVHITVDDNNSFALTADGTVYTWGSSSTMACVAPYLPPRVFELPPAQQIMGGCHILTCALAMDRTVWCWGFNGSGQLGDGTTTASEAPVQVTGLDGLDIVEIGVSGFSACARTVDDHVYCWGANTLGELGIGDSTVARSLVPVQLPFFDGSVPLDALRVSCFGGCATSDGDVYCWGKNTEAEIDATLVNAYTPRRVEIPLH
jgi:alpha-tubulin suppressor-like RCC1 family protein